MPFGASQNRPATAEASSRLSPAATWTVRAPCHAHPHLGESLPLSHRYLPASPLSSAASTPLSSSLRPSLRFRRELLPRKASVGSTATRPANAMANDVDAAGPAKAGG